jgi:hypothetical protein
VTRAGVPALEVKSIPRIFLVRLTKGGVVEMEEIHPDALSIACHLGRLALGACVEGMSYPSSQLSTCRMFAQNDRGNIARYRILTGD